MEQIQYTQLGNSYWSSKGVYQKQFDELLKQMPDQGCSLTVHTELARVINRLYYEYCNNGNMNAREISYEEESCSCYCQGDDEECEECGGDGYIYEEVEKDRIVSSFYQSFLNFIFNNIPTLEDDLYKIESIICRDSDEGDYFSEENMNHYDKVVDEIIYFTLTTQDKNLSEEYLNKNKA